MYVVWLAMAHWVVHCDAVDFLCGLWWWPVVSGHAMEVRFGRELRKVLTFFCQLRREGILSLAILNLFSVLSEAHSLTTVESAIEKRQTRTGMG